MPTPPSHSHATPRRFTRLAIACACIVTIASVAAATAGAATSVTFTTPAPGTPGAPIDLGQETAPRGTDAKTLTFGLNREDRRARRAAKQAEVLTKQQEAALASATQASERISAIEELLSLYRDDEAKLRAILEQRAIAQYMEGDTGELEFLMSGDGLSDLLTRGKAIQQQNAADADVAHEYAVTVDRLEELETVLADLRDVQGERAERLGERVERLDSQLVSAKLRKMDLTKAIESEADDLEGANGTWYVMDGAFQAKLFLPMGTSGYDGGTRTPKRPATPQEIATVLSDPKIELDASGIGDVSSGQIDGRLLNSLSAAAQAFGHIKVTSLKSDHGVMTASGNVSEHSYGCAADIGSIGSTYITPGAQTPGGEVERAVRFFAALPGDLAPHQVISLFDLGGPTLAMGDHGDHIHVGYSC